MDQNLQKELHNAKCQFDKKHGHTYYYYKRKNGENYLTIMSPNDWGENCPNQFLGGS